MWWVVKLKLMFPLKLQLWRHEAAPTECRSEEITVCHTCALFCDDELSGFLSLSRACMTSSVHEQEFRLMCHLLLPLIFIPPFLSWCQRDQSMSLTHVSHLHKLQVCSFYCIFSKLELMVMNLCVTSDLSQACMAFLTSCKTIT